MDEAKQILSHFPEIIPLIQNNNNYHKKLSKSIFVTFRDIRDPNFIDFFTDKF
jgi:hypothetical protein